MLTVRATRKLLRLTGPSTAPEDDRGTTLLGPWYATVLFWRPRVALLVNESTLLPALLPLAPASTLTSRIAGQVTTVVVAEEAIGVWPSLSGYLNEAWETYETEPEEIGSALAELHLRLCQAHDPEPLVGRAFGEAGRGVLMWRRSWTCPMDTPAFSGRTEWPSSRRCWLGDPDESQEPGEVEA